MRHTGINTEVDDRVENTVHVVESHCQYLCCFIRHLNVEGYHENLWNADQHSSQDDGAGRDDNFGYFDLVFDDYCDEEQVEGDEDDERCEEEEDSFVLFVVIKHTSVVLFHVHYLGEYWYYQTLGVHLE